MKQLELPFTVRARRILRRVNNVNLRAFRCWHKDAPGIHGVYVAADRADARAQFLNHLRRHEPDARYTDIRAKRSPAHDPASPQAQAGTKP